MPVMPRAATLAASGHARTWLGRLLAGPGVRITLLAWLAANLAVVLLARGHLPFERPAVHGRSYLGQLLAPNVAMLEVLGLIAVAFALTRNRVIPDVAGRAPARAVAARETAALVGYG